MTPDYNFYINFVYASALSICIPLIIGLTFKKYLRPNFTILLYLVFAGLLAELIAYLFHKYNLYNLFVFRSYTIVQFILLSIFFSKILSTSKAVMLIKILIFGFLVVAAIDLYVHGIRAMDDLSLTTASILLMIYSLITFFHIMQNPIYQNILSAPVFWFNAGILIYFSGGLILFIFNSYILKHSYKIHNELWGVINSVLNIIFNGLIAIGFWKTKRARI